MAADQASFFSLPDTVMRSHLSEDELHLLNVGDPSIFWESPSKVAFVIRHWIQSSLVLLALVVSAVVLLTQLGSRDIAYVIAGLVLMIFSVELAVFELRLFFRTYLRYIITPTRIIRMDGIIDRRSASIEWSKINDVSDHLGVLGQFFDFGNISIETANENSKFGELIDVPHPRKFLEQINQTRQKLAKPQPINEAALKALVSLERLLSDGGLLIHEQEVLQGDSIRRGWAVARAEVPPG